MTHASASNDPGDLTAVRHRTAKVDGLSIFYREAGDRRNPTLVLLHGFPSSSVMFRDLIPRLADRLRLIAPDYPGFGRSDAPAPGRFRYTFDRLAEVVDRFLEQQASPTTAFTCKAPAVRSRFPLYSGDSRRTTRV
jgi:pimeloyl-ACP methyl ester carboxylesterase